MLKGLKVALAVTSFCSLLLSGCSDDGESTAVTEVKHYTVNGAAVKGPMAGATVNAYNIDTSAPDLKGAIITSTLTDDKAQIIELLIPTNQATPFMLEIVANDNTVDITTGEYPLISTVRTIVTARMLLEGLPVYATPMTTIATNIAIENADSSEFYGGNEDEIISVGEFLSALDTAGKQVSTTFGFGIAGDIDIFTAAPIITDDTLTVEQFTEVLYYRGAIEAFSAIVINLHGEIDETNPDLDLTTDKVLSLLSNDLSDGVIDGKYEDIEIVSFSGVTRLENIITVDPATLMIPGTEISVVDIVQILTREKEITGTTTDASVLTEGSIQFELLAAINFTDVDGDGVGDRVDNCPVVPNSDQLDTDNNFVGNICDDDDDGDGVEDTEDHFPLDNTETLDTDGDGQGNNADLDDDGDGYFDFEDDLPLNKNEHIDTDKNGMGNNADPDDDADGVLDEEDAFPLDNTESKDTDLDGIGNNADTDDDGDGIEDEKDAFPLDFNEFLDSDLDGIGNNEDTDDDNDTILDDVDNCPLFANTDQADSNEDGTGDVCEAGIFNQSKWDDGSQFK